MKITIEISVEKLKQYLNDSGEVRLEFREAKRVFKSKLNGKELEKWIKRNPNKLPEGESQIVFNEYPTSFKVIEIKP